MKDYINLVRHYISGTFIVMMVAAFCLWYITKLSYTYTTEYHMRLNIDGVKTEVPCLISGKGTKLFGYRIYSRQSVRIPLSELKHTAIDSLDMITIDQNSLQTALTVRFSDIKIESIIDTVTIKKPQAE